MSERITADLAVIGGGPAGIAAAVRASEMGLRVALLDEAPRPGGQIWRHRARAELPALAAGWLARLEASQTRVLSGATVADAAPGWTLSAERGGEALRVESHAVLLATGARELFLPFPGWTLPGVMGVGGAQALLKSGAELRGRTAVVAGSGPLLLPVAAALAKAGVKVRLVAEQAEARRVAAFAGTLWRSPSRLLAAAAYRAAFATARYRTGTWVVRAEGDGTAVRHAVLTDGARSWTEPCDLLCVGYGLVPATELARLLGCELADRRVRVDAVQATSVRGVWCAGEPTGIGGVEAALVEGEIAGMAVAGVAVPPALLRERDRHRAFALRLQEAFAPRPELRALPSAATLVCRCEDVAMGRFNPEWGPRQAKLYTRAGMGPCQGRVCGPALDFLFGWGSDSVRVPVLPTAVSTLIGEEPAYNSEGVS